MKAIYYSLLALLISTNMQAQETEPNNGPEAIKIEKEDSKSRYSISISQNGVKFNDETKPKSEKVFSIDYLTLDLGFNTLLDETNYKSADAKSFVQYDSITSGKDVFSLRAGKSINVNLWPVIAKFRVLGADKQKIYLSTGIGFQFYNFRYNKDISYRTEPINHVVKDTISFSKNKVSLNYLTIPLSLTFKTKLAEKAWLVYGFGVTGGYRIDSWTKQKSSERGKEKNHDKFNFSNFNSCITGEFGINGYFRLYASYQVTPLHETALTQYPLSFGLRIGGV